MVYIVESGPNNYSHTIRIPVTLTIAGGAAVRVSTKNLSSSRSPTTPGRFNRLHPPPPPPPAATSATITWAANTEADLAGYRVYVGTRSDVYSFAGPFEVVGRTSFTVPNLPVSTTYYFTVTAFDKTGQESAKSGEFSRSIY
jgi:hypothetical protein